MAQKPLDAAFGTASESKKKKRGAFVAIAAVVGLAGISSVFAANVGINGGTQIKFSQGTTTIAACDDAIDASLGAYFDAVEEAFNLDTITLENVSADCANKALTLELYAGTDKLVTLTGTITGTTVVLGSDGIELPDETTDATGISNGVTADEAAVSYVSGITAAELSSTATRIVIEINEIN